MKKHTTSIFLIFIFILSFQTKAQIPVIVKDWARHAGNEDSTFKTPVVTDGSVVYVATSTIYTATGPDILIIRYNNEGVKIWSVNWSGPGINRDQASDITQDSLYLYVCGTTYTSSTNNYDYVTLKVKKDDGTIQWSKTYNGSASIYDAATAIGIDTAGKLLYVTGASNSTGSSLDYLTIQYNSENGNLKWVRMYDYAGLMDIPFDLTMKDGIDPVITGGSQNTIIDWDYASLEYDSIGDSDTSRITGASVGFDHAQAVKTDKLGNIYITGTVFQTSTDKDIHTIKITPNGTLDWQTSYDNSTADNGIDLLTDTSGNVYVCGLTSNTFTDEDYVLIKYNSSGSEVWHQFADLIGKDDEPKKMCFDSFGNIIITGKAWSHANSSFDFLTVAFDTTGSEIWRDTYDGKDHGDDMAKDISADAFGNIYVTGEAMIDDSLTTVTLKYRSDYYTDPQQVDTPSVANYFYTNSGQIADTTGSSISNDDLQFYTIHHYPQLYFQEGKMNMIFSHIDSDTTIADTLQRVDVSFLDSENPTKAYPVNEMTEGGYYNYFLSQCGDKPVTNVHGIEKLLFTDVYDDIDAIYSSNNAGLKLYFICNDGSDPVGKNYDEGNIGLRFDGQDTLEIENNWGLKVVTSVGGYVFEKPRVYQLDNGGNPVTLPWQLSWMITDEGEAKFSGWGSYDKNHPLVIEITKPMTSSIIYDAGLCWSTYLGGNDYDFLYGIAVSPTGNQYVIGSTLSSNFPTPTGFSTSFSSPQKICLNRFDQNHVLMWGTYFGGSGGEQEGIDVKCKTNGDVYIVGYTICSNLYIIGQGTQYVDNSANGLEDGFIACFDSTGLPNWSTYFGSTGSDRIFSLDFDSNDNLYITGYASEGNFPISTPNGSFDQPYGGSQDAFIAKFDNNDSLLWSTFIGGGESDWGGAIMCNANDEVLIHGGTSSNDFKPFNPGSAFIDTSLGGAVDDFLIKFSDSNQRQWATLIGGSGDEIIIPMGIPGPRNSIAFDSKNNIYAVGTTPSSDFSLLSSTGFYDSTNTDYGGYIMKFSASSYSKIWSSFISGGQGEENISSVATDENDNVFVMGSTSDTAMFLRTYQTLYYQDSLRGSFSPYAKDACIFAFDSLNNMIYGSYFGGFQTHPYGEFITDIAIEDNHIYFTGYTACQSNTGKHFPFFDLGIGGYIDTTFNGGSIDGFITELCLENLVGISERKAEFVDITAFPNPFIDFITLKFSSDKSKALSLTVFNSLGQVIKSEMDLRKVNEIREDFRLLKPGIYFVRLQAEYSGSTIRIIKME